MLTSDGDNMHYKYNFNQDCNRRNSYNIIDYDDCNDSSSRTTRGTECINISITGKKPSLKSFEDIKTLLTQGRKREVKLALRENSWPVTSIVRSQLWPLLCAQHQIGKTMLDGFYWDMVNQVFGTTELPNKAILLPQFVDASHCLPYHLSLRGRGVADRVVSVLGYACPDITYSPSLYPICTLLLHFMSEEECYHCLASLVAARDKVFITQTKLLYEVTWKTVMQIAKKYAKAATAYLTRQCSESRVERIYMDWMWWILAGLPFAHLVRVMDCFFHEGIKVWYRVAIAILQLFYKHCNTQNSVWANELNNGAESAIMKFSQNIPVSPTKLLRTSFSIRALSSAYISRVFIKTEMVLKSRSVLNGSRHLVRSRSNDNLPTSQSQVNIQMMSHTLTIRELFTLWSWLPVRITMYQPILLYTTEEHGCSLTTFYFRVEQHEPTLLMIKTCNNEVFGAYCSSRWYERNMKDDRGNRQAYFGTGETFLFSLYPERAKYPWVGMGSGDKESLGHAAELFMAADSKMITIGGGQGQAIWMDENIRFGKTDHCQTFNNPPLCASGDFEVRVLEVYGFSGA
ncbi:TBC1 domain family member 24 isoform X1 [Ctenocephalides felis]|uniref:TBC1 domain family member 24 isoform X1 n=1 Tax=Ctenocephalides felis TaxID=7515 RepID=UPI000E6E17AA|nr:TBC1 domain family member 24 isoform X1 [Ctenocephalides felis]